LDVKPKIELEHDGDAIEFTNFEESELKIAQEEEKDIKMGPGERKEKKQGRPRKRPDEKTRRKARWERKQLRKAMSYLDTSTGQKDLAVKKKDTSIGRKDLEEKRKVTEEVSQEELNKKENERSENLIKHGYYSRNKHLLEGYSERKRQIIENGILKDYSPEALFFLHKQDRMRDKRKFRTYKFQRDIKCKICHKTVFRNAYNHATKEHGFEYKDTCPICLESNLTNLEDHFRQTHFGEIPLKCNVCPAVCYTPKDLNNHIVTHTTAVRLSCPMVGCGFNFINEEDLAKHKLSHKIRKPELYDETLLPRPKSFKGTCEICGVHITGHTRSRFNHRLKSHKLMVHSSPEEKCPACPKAFRTKDNLMRHYERVHASVNAKRLVCPFKGCNKTFPSRINLKCHQIYHRPPKFRCDKCSKPYFFKPYLDVHYPKCQGERPDASP